jgi:hypothetical protein
MKHIGQGYWQISEALAKQLAQQCGGLPPHGWQREVSHNGQSYWLCRTITGALEGRRVQVWALREKTC